MANFTAAAASNPAMCVTITDANGESWSFREDRAHADSIRMDMRMGGIVGLMSRPVREVLATLKRAFWDESSATTFWFTPMGHDHLLDDTQYACKFNFSFWFRSDGRMGRVQVGPIKMLGGTAQAFADFPLAEHYEERWLDAQRAAIALWETLKRESGNVDGLLTR